MDNDIRYGYYGGGSECGNVRRGVKIVMEHDCCVDIRPKSKVDSNNSAYTTTSSSKESMQSIFPNQSEIFRIVDVQEKAVCKYSIQICLKCTYQLINATENEQQIMKIFMYDVKMTPFLTI